jgi:DNA gyrase subunit A
MIPVMTFDAGDNLMMATRKGLVKKTPLVAYANVRKSGLIAILLRDDDELIEVKITNKEKEPLLVTKYGQCIRFKETDVRVTGRSSMGVRGINLTDDDEVVAMQLDTQGEYLLVVSEYGLGKLTQISEFTAQNRGGKRVRCYKILEKTGNVIAAKPVDLDQELMLITTEGIIIRMPCDGISVLGRITSGVKLINLDEGVTVAGVARVKDRVGEAGEDISLSEEEDMPETEEDPEETEE